MGGEVPLESQLPLLETIKTQMYRYIDVYTCTCSCCFVSGVNEVYTCMFIFKAVLYLGVLKMAWLYLRKYMYVTAFSLGHTL